MMLSSMSILEPQCFEWIISQLLISNLLIDLHLQIKAIFIYVRLQ